MTALFRRDRLVAGIVAGLVGGVLIDLYLFITALHGVPSALTGMYLFVASTLIGPSAFTGVPVAG